MKTSTIRLIAVILILTAINILGITGMRHSTAVGWGAGESFGTAGGSGASSGKQYIASMSFAGSAGDASPNIDATSATGQIFAGDTGYWGSSPGPGYWVPNSLSDSNCIVPYGGNQYNPNGDNTDIGKLIYGTSGNCKDGMIVACKWSIASLAASNVATSRDIDEKLSIGIAKDGILDATNAIYVYVDETGLSDEDTIPNTSGLSGVGLYSLTDNNYLALHFQGVSSDIDIIANSVQLQCEEAASTGATGVDGQNGTGAPERFHFYVEAPINGTITDVHRNVVAFDASAVYCITDQGSVDLQIVVDDGGADNLLSSAVTCSSTEASVTAPFGGAHGSDTIPDAAYLDLVFSNVTGTPGSVTITLVE